MAKAEAGKTYAQIINRRCHWLFDHEKLPEYNENHIQAVDVTGNIPSIGDDWTGTVFIPHSKTTEELEVEAGALKEAAEKTEKQVIKTMPRVQALIAKSRADLKNEIQSANLNQLKDVVEDLAVVVHILAKREFK